VRPLAAASQMGAQGSSPFSRKQNAQSPSYLARGLGVGLGVSVGFGVDECVGIGVDGCVGVDSKVITGGTHAVHWMTIKSPYSIPDILCFIAAFLPSSSLATAALRWVVRRLLNCLWTSLQNIPDWGVRQPQFGLLLFPTQLYNSSPWFSSASFQKTKRGASLRYALIHNPLEVFV